MRDGRSTPRAVVLLSGGLDSGTALACAIARDGCAAHCLSVRYGQRHLREIEAARRVAEHLGAAEHRVIDLDLSRFGGSALIAADEPVPRDRPLDDTEIPRTYVPGRNLIFLSLAAAWAEVLGAGRIYAGLTAVDYSGYPDCRPEFVAAFQAAAEQALAAVVEGRQRLAVITPLIDLGKAEIIRLGLSLGVDYGLTHSCYDPVGEQGLACGHCDACRHRLKGFEEAGVEDPVKYA